MKKKNKQKGPVIYVGPGFRDTDLTTFKIFADGIPENYVGNPTYELLFVSPEELDEVRREDCSEWNCPQCALSEGRCRTREERW